MNFIIVLAALIAFAAARPEGDADATAVRYDNTQAGPEGFEFE